MPQIESAPAAPDPALDPREIVARKRDGGALTDEQMRTLVLGFAKGTVPDYQVAAFLMAAYWHGLSTDETASMTRAMVDSGRTLPLASVTRPKVDKHSTGGVSDGVTLVFAPLAAALGLAVAKLSGRGLGHTGGTLDKLESIPGLQTNLSPEELEAQVRRVGCAIAGQSEDLVPADAKLYALRDATATVASIPLIAASVMSKKLAVGSDLILLDVKAGSGAFMKTPEAAAALAEACVRLAVASDRRAAAAVTDMSQPLGTAVGNALEVAEAVRVLLGQEHGRLRELAVRFAQRALTQIEGRQPGDSMEAAERALDDGRAAETFARMIAAQGGDPRVVEDPSGVLPTAPTIIDVVAPTEGHLAAVDAEAIGRAALLLGAGRTRERDAVDPSVGVEFDLRIGDRVESGQPIGRVHARDPASADVAASQVVNAITLSNEPVEPLPLVLGWHGEGTA